jgi:carbonic anhydrase/acetyltransferase-like protein (isoleucine patch superfamily)
VRKQAPENSFRDSMLLARGKQERLFARRRGMKESFLDQNPGSVNDPYEMTREDPLVWFSRGVGKLRTLWLARTYAFASFGKGAWVHYSCRVTRSAAAYISIGARVGLARDVRLDVSAPPRTDSPILIFEDGSGMQRRGVISAQNRIHVMRNVIFGPSVLVMDHSREIEAGSDPTGRKRATEGGTIRIEEECWIGFGAVIVCERGELVIGRHSVVGANSVVTRSIPPYSVVAGDPARIVKQYDFSKGKWVLGCIRPAVGADQEDPEPAIFFETRM